MTEITPIIIRSYITELQANGVSERNGAPLSYNTIAKHYNVLHTFFEAAVTDEIIEFSPMQRMKKPKPKKDEIKTDAKALTLDQSKRLIECLTAVDRDQAVFIRFRHFSLGRMGKDIFQYFRLPHSVCIVNMSMD